MATIEEIKERELADTPLVLFRCVFTDLSVQRWSTHQVTVSGEPYEARVMAHTGFELRLGSDDGLDGLARLSVTLANADGYFSALTRGGGWKGARLTASFRFFDVETGHPSSEEIVLFQGVVSGPEESNERIVRIGVTNRLGLQRISLPEVRIQRFCPWTFPRNDAERIAAAGGGRWSRFHRCGYSPDVVGGVGTAAGSGPFLDCDRTRGQCEERGMFDRDASQRTTRRFGGMEFVPASTLVRGFGEHGFRQSAVLTNEAKYNDAVPLVYGTAWLDAPVVLAKNDGNLTRLEVLAGLGEMQAVRKVVVNGMEIPAGVTGTDMTGTGWYNVVSLGAREGGFNLDFADAGGNPLGDPYGSLAFLSVVVPNGLSDGQRLPRVELLCDGLKLATFGLDGEPVGDVFTNNPAWVLLDILARSGWELDGMDTASFARAAVYCAEPVAAEDIYGNPRTTARYQCNLALRGRRSVAEIVRGVRASSNLYLGFDTAGRLRCSIEGSLAVQQPVKPAGSNASAPLNGGWPAYEFGDGSNGFSGIARGDHGGSSLRVYSRSAADAPNRFTIELQDEANDYQQDSLSLVDIDDAVNTGHEISAGLPAAGVPNLHQAARLVRRQIEKSLRGNLYVEFETSVRSVLLRPGDLITLTAQREGLDRQPFRVLRVVPGLNHGRAAITAQIHDDGWYGDELGGGMGSAGRSRLPAAGVSGPRPLVGSAWDASQSQMFEVEEQLTDREDGGVEVELAAEFPVPAQPARSRAQTPLISLSPAIGPAGGTLGGGQTLYYAVSGVDPSGAEGPLSFVVRAVIPAGSNNNQITLGPLGFSPETASFHVYRGSTPAQLLRIASSTPVSSSFTDGGLTAELAGPPDAHFDHACFDWRLEVHPPTGVTSWSANTIASASLQLGPGEVAGMAVRILSGQGRGQERIIGSHTANSITVTTPWAVTPNATSVFAVVEPGWRPGAKANSSPARFAVPNREGAVVHIAGHAVNAVGVQSNPALAPITRWQIGGGASAGADSDVAPAPVFSLTTAGLGVVELQAVSFPTLDNTKSVDAGTLILHYWNELSAPPQLALDAAVDGSASTWTLTADGGFAVGALAVVDAEVVEVQAISGDGTVIEVRRASHGSSAAAHSNGATVFLLDRRSFVAPFARNFFGSPASGGFSYPIDLPSARIVAADLFVTNARGNSETTKVNYAGLAGGGLRTLQGGQFSMQVGGHLAIQADATPPLVIENARAVREIVAVTGEAPSEGPVIVQLRMDAEVYATLTIPAGATTSNVVPGAGLPPLTALSRLHLDITAVPQAAGSSPGRDLTVTIRL